MLQEWPLRLMRRSSDKVMWFRTSQFALLPFAGAKAAGTTVIGEPPIVIEPGFVPGRKIRFDGIGVDGRTTEFPRAREYPRVAALTTFGEKMCVSCKPNTLARCRLDSLKMGSVCGFVLVPSSQLPLT